MHLPFPSSRSSRYALIALNVVLGVILVSIAYYAGRHAAGSPDSQSDTPQVSQDESEESPSTVWAQELLQVPELSVRWIDEPQRIPLPFDTNMRSFMESQFAELGSNGFVYEAFLLGEIDIPNHPGEVARLVEETVTWNPGDLGKGSYVFYLLEPDSSSSDAVLLLSTIENHNGWQPFTYPHDNSSDILKERLRAINPPHLFLSEQTIPEIQAVDQQTDTNGNHFSLIATSYRLSKETRDEIKERSFAAATRMDGTALFSYDSPSPGIVGAIEGTLYQELPNGQLAWYDLQLPFWQPNTEIPFQSIKIRWENGVTDETPFFKGVSGGCGFLSPTHVVHPDPALLIPAGTLVQTNETIYTLRDLHAHETYQNWQHYPEHANGTYEDYVASHPIFLYQTPLNQWIEFTNNQSISPAECGKPVIYLYPQTPTDLTVQVAPRGGFTKTDPPYGSGWRVHALPDGTLTDLATGLTYPYLFWEGHGGTYTPPEHYWVVAQADVHTFLISTLARLGLNAQERLDFLEFWEPRMQKAPYYRIGFYGTSYMNQIAPLSLSTKPDTLIRLLMDPQPLDAEEPSYPPLLPATPERTGFTVVEWGGVLRQED